MTEQTPTSTPSATPADTPDPSDELAQLRADVDAATARAEAAEKAAADATGKEPRYAAYDDIYQKFVPGVFDTKAKATKAAKDAKVKDFTVREV